jgi:menaquinone-dependent protoporphyrinogen oxidase
LETKVLVAYSSKYGATAGIAEKIGEILRESGLDADVRPFKKINDISLYNAFVLGSALYMFQWRKDAAVFLSHNEVTLSGKPVWLFSSGPLGPEETKQSEAFRSNKLQPVFDRIHPRDIIVFRGQLDMSKLSGFEAFFFRRAKMTSGDYRDWSLITIWARKIVVELKK